MWEKSRAHKEDAINKGELKPLQMRQDELSFKVEKQQEETKAPARRAGNDEPVQVRKGQRPFTPAWKTLCKRRPRWVSPNKKKRKTALGVRGGRWESGLERKEDEV